MSPAPSVRFSIRAALFALPIAVYILGSFALYSSVPHYPYQVLQAYQESKLVQNERVETVFVGDSSLGNAIDTRQFSEETGSESVSLALTGLYSYGGAYGMARRAMEVYPNMETVVVMLSPDTFQRPESPRGLVLTTPLRDLGRLDPTVRDGAVTDLVKLVVSTDVQRYPFELLFGRSVSADRLMGTDDGRLLDYPHQSKTRAQPAVKVFGDVAQGKTEYLEALGRLAEARGIRVVYVHGPYWEDQLLASGPFLDAAERELASSGVPFIQARFAIPTEKMGDAADHVAPEYKQEYTSRYAEALAPFVE